MVIGLWVLFCVVLIGGLALGGYLFCKQETGWDLVVVLTTVLLSIFIGCYGFWWCHNTAADARVLKDQQSNLSNDLNREIIVTAEDGREIFYYKGKCDIETDHDDNYILFEGEDGLRRMIYYGITDTVLIMELPND